MPETASQGPVPKQAAPKTKPPAPKLTLRQALRDSSEGYKKIWPFVRKYKVRFFASIVAGAASAALTAAQAKVLKVVTKTTFEDPATAKHTISLLTQTVRAIFHGGVMPASPVEMAAGAALSQPTGFISTAAAAAAAHTALIHVLLACSLVPAVIILRCVCDYLESYYLSWVSLRVLNDMRVKLFQHILSQSLDFYNKSKIGSLISRVSNDTRSAQLAITAVTDDIVTQPLTIIFVVGYMLHTDWRFTLYALCFFPLCLLPLIIFGKRVRRMGLMDEAYNAELMVILHEALSGIRLVKALAREPYEEKRFSASSSAMIKMALRVRKAMAIVPAMIEGVGAFGAAAALVYVSFSHMEASTFFSLLVSLFLIYQPAKKLSKVHVSLQKTIAATVKIFEILETKPTIEDAPDALVLKRSSGGVEFDNVTFTYNAKRPPALRGVSLKVPAGKSYALVGESGAGKTTMYSLLLRFYEVQQGAIRLDGKDIRSLTQRSLREQIAIVSQDTFLFNTTVMENIRYGRLDATDEEVYEAARQAYAHDFILAQPKGYKTVIGDRGSMISGGQQQRLAIARALLRNAPILLLDEATSALDSESEKEIQAALQRLAVGRTVIAIAHRLSTILSADQIVVMQKGEIMEVGRHQELLNQSGLYRRLYDLQFNRGEAEKQDRPLLASVT